MKSQAYDILIIGHISLDEIIYDGQLTRSLGGAALFASYATVAGGAKTGLLVKTTEQARDLLKAFPIPEADIYPVLTSELTSIRNEYLTADRETRICSVLGLADPFTPKDLPEVDTGIYYLAGLIAGDYSDDLIELLATKGKVALDVQGFLRRPENGNLVYRDWREKKKYLPMVDFLKTDQLEAKIMTGADDRYEAAKILFQMGAREIMITHHSEVIVYDGHEFFSEPLKPRNLSGRTGRGDTCFSGYIAERLKKAPGKALLYAAALVSLKIETPGPFTGSRSDVEDYIRQFFSIH